MRGLMRGAGSSGGSWGGSWGAHEGVADGGRGLKGEAHAGVLGRGNLADRR